MKASQLYVGEYYAWTAQPPKGRLATNAKKVRLRGTETRKGRWDKNAKTFAKITIVDTGNEKTVRAREIVDFWDSYEGEMEMIQREAREKDEELHRATVRNALIASVLSQRLREATGMDLIGILDYHAYSNNVVIPVAPLMMWLNITQDEIENLVDKHIEGESL